MSARSTNITLQNNSNCCLVLLGASLDHGVWNPNPPEFIGSQSKGAWENDSNGFMTGDQGNATYAIIQATIQGTGVVYADLGHVLLGWDNPYAGSNEYYQSVPSGFNLVRSGGDGDNATVVWTLNNSK